MDAAQSTAIGTIDVPQQMSGTAAGRPSLVDAAATRASSAAKTTKSQVKPPKGALRPDAFPRVQGTRQPDDRRLPSGTARAEALDAAAVLGIDDMWPLNGAQVGSLTPTLVAHSTGDGSALHYKFTVCQEPENSEDHSLDDWCWWTDFPVGSGDLPAEVNSWKVPAGELKWGTTYAWKVEVTSESGVWETSPYRTFVTGARQPSIGAHLAAREESGQEFHALSGNYTTTVADVSVATVGPALSIVRSYNSMDARRDRLFGAGWSTRFDMKVEAEPSESLLVTYPDGRRLRFAPKGNGSFQPPPGMHATLATVSGGGWKLMDKSSTVYHFNAQGRLTRVVDARGRAQELAYGTDGKLAKVTTVGGRSLTFGWSGGHVSSVSTDPVNGAPQTWTYSYNGDTLTQACNPGPVPNCTTYGYTTGSLYRGLVEDDEPVGYWRLGEPATQPAPTPPPDYCTITPEFCGPQLTTEARSLGWGAGTATYEGDVTLEQPGALIGSTDTAAGFTGDSTLWLPRMALARLTDQLSVELWFKTTTSGMLAYSSGVGGLLDGAPLLYVGTDGKLRGQFPIVGSNGTAVVSPITSPSTVTNGQWHHVVLSGSGTRQTLYLDGAALGSRTGAISRTWSVSTTIGNGLTSADWPASKPEDPNDLYTWWGFVGQIDELALYDRPLSAGEVTEHIQARLAAAPHLLAKITLPSGRVWAQNTYSTAKDRLQNHTDQHGGTWKLTEPTPVDLATGESTVNMLDPNDNKITTQHDAWRGYRTIARTDQLEKKTTYGYDSGGYLSSVEDPNGVFTNRSFDKRGNVLATAQCQNTDPTPGLFLSCFDSESTTDPPVNKWWFSYFVNKDNEFDPRNDRVIKVRDGRSSSATDNTYATTFEYNQYGEQTKQTSPATSDFPNGRSATVTYTDGSEPAASGGSTPAGLVKTRTDPKGNATTFAYTAAGDVAEQTESTGLVTRFEHDALGRTMNQTQISDAEPNGVKTTFTYDNLGRLITQTAPGVKNEITNITHTAKTSYTYDPDGNTVTETVTDLTGGDTERTASYTYDAYGREESRTDPEGGVVRTTWDALGLQATVTDELGSVFGYTYTKRGEQASRTLKNWTGSPVSPQPAKEITLESFSYDPGGRLAAQVDAMGRKTSYTYYANDLLAQVIADDVKLNGSTTAKDVVLEANTYDAAGNLTGKVVGRGITTTEHVYDAASRLTSSTLDPATLKRKTAYEYDANDRVTKETRTGAGSSRAESVTYAYNTAGIKTRQTVENGDEDLVTTWTVDDRGLTTAVIDPRGNADGATAADYTTTNRYDVLGRLIETKTPSVQIEKGGTPQQGRPTIRVGYNSAGWRTHVQDPEGRLFVSGFDGRGRRTSQASPSYTPPGGTALTPKTTYTYDAAGRLTKTTDPRGHATTVEYDALGNPVRVTDPPAAQGQPAGQWVSEYDLLGEELAALDPTGARAQATYDDLGRQITRTVIERRPTNTTYTTTLEYNDAGHLTKQVHPGNKAISYTVNAAREVTAKTDPNNNTATFAYDLAGRPLKRTDALGNAATVEYDLAGRATGVKRLDSTGSTVKAEGYGYDPAGNTTRHTSGEGHVTRRSYDATNLLTELVEPVSATESITTSFGYDAAGARTRVTDGRGNATWTSYNSLGLIETLTEPATTAHPAAADRTWTHVYDAAGNETALIKPGGVRLDRTYDALNRLTKVSGSGAGIVAPDKTYTYDLADRPTTVGDHTLEFNDRSLLTKVSTPSGTTSSFAYDALGNPTQRVDATGTTTYTWDAGNRLKTVTDPVSGRVNTYDYDKANRLTTITSANPVNAQSYTYDALNRPLTHTLKNSSGGQLAKVTYGWDKDDNLTSKITEGLAGAGSNSYGYDHVGRLTSWTGPDGTTTSYGWDAAGNRTRAGDKTYTYDERNRLTAGDGSTYTYTPRGTLASQTKDGATRHVTFDAFDRLISDGDSAYTYDVFDRMLAREKSGGGQQRFVYAGLTNDIIAITNQSGAVQASYGRNPTGGLVSVKEGGGPAVGALTDLHDDLIGTFSGSTLASTTTYNPFGEVTAQAGTQHALGYQSEYTDPDTGSVNMHARWYQPGTGTFASRDDWTLEPNPSARMNRYAYGQANPLTHTDPTGHKPANDPDYEWCKIWDAHCLTPDDVAKGPCKWSDPRPECNKPPPKPDPCAEYSNKCPNNKHGTKNEAKPTQKSTPKPPGGHKPPSTTPVNHDPKDRDPKEPVRGPDIPWGDFCGKECMIDGHPALEDIWPIPIIWLAGSFVVALGGALEAVAPIVLAPIALLPTGSTPEVPSSGDPVPEPPEGNPSPPYADFIIHCIPNPYKTGECIDGVAAVKPPSNRSCEPKEPNSFPSGTKVLMADGSTKAIEDIKIGDQVVATDPETGRTEAKPVTALIAGNGDKRLVKITVDGDGAGGTATSDITATDNHPFWVPALRDWVVAGQLQPSMWLQTSAGTYVQVTAVEAWTAIKRVHNLTVGGLHTYYVVTGDEAILVHNAGGSDPCPLYRSDTRDPDEIFESGFEPRGDNMDLLEHASGYSTDSGYVATTTSESVAIRRGGNVYEIRGVEGVDVNIEFPANPFSHELEIAVPGRIDPSCIVSCRTRDGKLIPNPNYNGQ